jgi:hypothetical protein
MVRAVTCMGQRLSADEPGVMRVGGFLVTRWLGADATMPLWTRAGSAVCRAPGRLTHAAFHAFSG